TTGWFLAVQLGYTALAWPAFGWVVAALVLVTLMTIQGLGFLTPVNVWVCLELQKPKPDLARISHWMSWYFYAVAAQGAMQIAIRVVMTPFGTGLGGQRNRTAKRGWSGPGAAGTIPPGWLVTSSGGRGRAIWQRRRG